MGFHPIIPHSAGLNFLKKNLENRVDKQVPTSDLVKMAEFVLSNYCFEVNLKKYFSKYHEQL